MQRLIEVMAILRDPENGCPWDVAQTFKTIAPYTIEEAYEVADAIERENMEDLREELGDLLFQVVFHSRMAEEKGAYSFDDVAQSIVDKMKRRHPHIFADATLDTQSKLKNNWEDQKARERRAKRESERSLSALAGVALNLPALSRAEKIQKRAKRVGFDWNSLQPVIEKVGEELSEVVAAEQGSDPAAVEEEIGDLLFAVVNLARHVNVDPETSLRTATVKFEKRFRGVETKAQSIGIEITDASLSELDKLWNEVKNEE